MKKLFCLLLIAFATTYTYAQSPEEIDEELMKLDKSLPPAPDAVYLTFDFLSKYDFSPNDKNKEYRNKVWNTPLDKDPDVSRINDIRWVFKNEKEAKQFFTKYGKALGEGGPQLTNVATFTGADELYVFGISEGMKRINDSFGLPITFYCCVFRVGNVVGKLFFTTKNTVAVDAARPFVEEAIRRVNAYVKGK